MHVKRLNPAGTAWVEPEAGSLNVDRAREAAGRQLPSLADVAGAPFAAWDEPNASAVAQIRVKRFTPTRRPADPVGPAVARRRCRRREQAGAVAGTFRAAARGASIAARRRRAGTR